MTIFTRLEQWEEQGIISSEQHILLAGLSRGEPFSLFLDLNILLYAGILAFVAGLGWTATTWSQQLGDVLVLTILSTLLAACFWYCFSRAPAWSPGETPSPNLVFDYVVYLGSLIWSVELAYLENRFHLLSGEWDLYLLATAGLFFFLAGTVGLLRFPDTLTRLHALTKADNLGLGLIVLGLLPQVDGVLNGLKLIAIWLLVLVSGADAGQLIARAARRAVRRGPST